MAHTLLDLLWRHRSTPPSAPRRGPKARLTIDDVVAAAVRRADSEGLAALTLRRLAGDLGTSTMSLYTHVDSRDDLLVLMADAVRRTSPPPDFAAADWRDRVRALAEAELALLVQHPWLSDVTDERLALGPGTIETYDRQLAAFTPLGLDDVTTDAALSFVLDFVRSGARARQQRATDGDLAAGWGELGARLAAYVGDDFPLARRVGAAAGAAMQGPYSTEHAWSFGLDRVISALDGLAGP